jgi:ketosteroid isomerase-like protein
MLDAQTAAQFADEWYTAWNAHDLDAILSHYADDIEFTSPFVVALNDDPTGTLHGKDALRAYFTRAFERFPDLRFEPIATMVGVDSVTLHYVSVEDRLTAEVMTLGSDNHVVRVLAHYG